MSLDHEEVLSIQRRAMRDFVRMLGSSAPDSRFDEQGGVTAAIVPRCPRRSVPNSVTYDDPEALLERLGRLAELYEDAGIAAWTVWVPDFERETEAALEAAGHAFDGQPTAMALELERWRAPELGDLDWDSDGDGEAAARLNDLAYGLHEDGMGPALVSPPDFVRQYRARVDGEVVCVLGTIDHDDDLGFYFVATHPDHRGKGLASRLMAAALVEAAERGMRTSSLQSSALGEPVYRRLGFQPYFRLHMYERRARA